MRKIFTFTAVLCGFMLVASPASAQKSKKKKKGKTEAAAPDKDKSIKDLTKSCIEFDGLFKVYQDTVTGKSYLV